MTSLRTTVRDHLNRLALLIGQIVLRLALAGVVLVGFGLFMDAVHTEGVANAPAPTPTQQAPAEQGDGFADHHFFNEGATLDTSHIDDLREDPEGQCIAGQGVMTPAGTCVDAIAIWESEVDPSVWAELRTAYPRDIDHSDATETALRVPAEFVILGGEGGEDVLAVDMARPLTPRLIG